MPEGQAEANDSPPAPEMRCAFRIVGDDLDPDEVTRLTGLEPTESWRKGDPHVTPTGFVRSPRPTSAWILNTPTVYSVDLPELLDGLLDRVEPSQPAIVELLERTKSTAEVSLHIFMSDQAPIGTISNATLQRIVALNADLDCDLYVVEDDRLVESGLHDA